MIGKVLIMLFSFLLFAALWDLVEAGMWLQLGLAMFSTSGLTFLLFFGGKNV